MNLLLDTHVLLWDLDGNPRLGDRAAADIVNPRNQVWVSAVSAWEIAIKYALGNLPMDEPPALAVVTADAQFAPSDVPLLAADR